MDLLEKLRDEIGDKNELVVCVGNPLRGDDGVGAYIGRKLIERGLGSRVLNVEVALENFIMKIANSKPDVVLFVDAVYQEGLKAGSIVFQELKDVEDYVRLLSTHYIPLGFASKYLKALVPEMGVYLLGIKVKSLEYNEKLSREVEEAADYVVDVLFRFLLETESGDLVDQGPGKGAQSAHGQVQEEQQHQGA